MGTLASLTGTVYFLELIKKINLAKNHVDKISSYNLTTHLLKILKGMKGAVEHPPCSAVNPADHCLDENPNRSLPI